MCIGNKKMNRTECKKKKKKNRKFGFIRYFAMHIQQHLMLLLIPNRRTKSSHFNSIIQTDEIILESIENNSNKTCMHRSIFLREL